ncbi:Kinesin-like protein kif21b [Geranomyces variabilis]|uniref:Kinesin-like protein kif21b n=1 Tax=Geranomyces variabilis TaxID=109894 RepID=A0AAD5TQ40_9FUNG|nr:Kinesin-like protein kif21b [Geranomyces variabilis]
MASTSVKVALRVRPLSAKEVLASAQECISFVAPGTPQVSIAPTNSTSVAESLGLSSVAPGGSGSAKSFTYDHVFDTLSTQEEVYEGCCRPLVDRFLEGFNATILAYGQTGSGKTHSMGTGLEVAAEPGNEGIVPRAIYYLFDKLQSQAAISPGGFKYEVFVSFLELYNEEIVDLLLPKAKDGSTATNSSALSIREDGTGKIRWYGIKEQPVSSPQELLDVLEKGSLCRTTGSTDMNASSSRSHAIFSVILKQQKWGAGHGQAASTEGLAVTPNDATDAASGQELTNDEVVDPSTHPGGSFQTTLSKFHFVDLAGSERLKRTNAEGDRKKEGISINQGLLALGNVISALGDDARRSANSHVPYRDSKLTRMLQDSLGGNSQTLMLACVSPSDTNYAETLNTLNYANRARNIKNKVVINQEWAAGSANSIAMEREIRLLRATVAQLRSESRGELTGGDPGSAGYLSNQRAVVSGTIRDRDAQLRMQRERDLEAQVEDLQKERDSTRFENDRLKFRCFRLQDRCRTLSKELADAIVRRDEVAVAYSQTLVPGKKRKTAPRLSEEGSGKARRVSDDENTSRRETVPRSEVKTEETHSDVENEDGDTLVANEMPGLRGEADQQTAARQQISAHPIIQSYVRSISNLKFRLADAEDKITWYHDIVATLGGKGRNGRTAFTAPSRGGDSTLWTEDEIGMDATTDMELGISPKPISQQLAGVEAEDYPAADVEAAGERRVLDAMAQVPFQPEDPDYNDENCDATGPKLYGIPKAISLVREPSALFSSEDPTEEFSPPEEVNEDVYSAIAKIQSDIAEHEKLVFRIAHRDAEYETMRTAYEQKLRDLQTQLMQSKKERDLALQRVQDSGKREEKKGTVAIKQRYEDKKKQLERQIEEFRRKLADTSRTRDERRGKDEGLMRGLKDTINSMKVEKSRMLKDLKKERERARSLEMNSRREIANLRKKEKKAIDLVRKMELKSQMQLQRVTNQRRTDDVRQRNSVMRILKKTTTPHRISKPGTTSGSASPKRRSISQGTWKVTTSAEPRSTSGSGVGIRRMPTTGKLSAKTSPNSKLGSTVSLEGSLPVRAAVTKELLDKELEACVAVRRAQKEVDSLKAPLAKLVGEQRVLLDEREKVVRAEEAISGRYEPEAWQYMDGRLAELDQAIAVFNDKIANCQSLIKRPVDGRTDAMQQSFEIGWENTLNLLRTVDPFELEAVLELYLDDVVGLRHALEESRNEGSEQQAKLKDKEALVADLMISLQQAKSECREKDLELEKAMLSIPSQPAPKILTTDHADEGLPLPITNDAEPQVMAARRKNAWSEVVAPAVLESDDMDIASDSDEEPDVWPATTSGMEPSACLDQNGDSAPNCGDTAPLADEPVNIPPSLPSATDAHPSDPPAISRHWPAATKIDPKLEPLPEPMSFLDRLTLLGGGDIAKKWGAKSSAARGSGTDEGKENVQVHSNGGSLPLPAPAADGQRSSPIPTIEHTPPRGRAGLPPAIAIPGSRHLENRSGGGLLPRSASVSPSKRSMHHDRENIRPSTPTSPVADNDDTRRHRSPSWTYGRDLSPRNSVGSQPPFITRPSNPGPERSPTSPARKSPASDPFLPSVHLVPPSLVVQPPASATGMRPSASGTDVFERLAHKHTLASQAKVIHRGNETTAAPTQSTGSLATGAVVPSNEETDPSSRPPRRKTSGTDINQG